MISEVYYHGNHFHAKILNLMFLLTRTFDPKIFYRDQFSDTDKGELALKSGKQSQKWER